MPPILVQSASFSGSSSPVSGTFAGTTTAGNCVLALIGTGGSTPGTVSGVTLAGAAGNFYQIESQLGSATFAAIWADPGCAGGGTVTAISFAGGAGSQAAAGWVTEWSGLAPVLPGDQVSGQAGTSAVSAWSSGTAPPSLYPVEVFTGIAAITSSASPSVTGPVSPWINLGTITRGPFGVDAGYQWSVTPQSSPPYAGSVSPAGSYAAVTAGLRSVQPFAPEPAVPVFLAGYPPQQSDMTTLWSSVAAFCQQRVVFRASQTTTATVLTNGVPAPGTLTATFTSSGQWISPVTGNVVVQCWGGGGGGGGGASSNGGGGGGGGEYASEPAYPVVAGNSYSVVVAGTASGGSTGSGGANGGLSSFNGTGVVAHGGQAGSGETGGTGGTGSTNTTHHNGGTGGSNTSTGGGGGGGSGGSTGAGGAGGSSSSGTGGAGGTAGTGGGTAGSAGGNNDAASSNATAPGGGAGGNGAAGTGGSGAIAFTSVQSRSYFGNGSLRNVNGDNYQNYSSGNPGGDGDQYSFWDFVNISADLAGLTITGVYLTITNLHTWYNSGGYAVIGQAGSGFYEYLSTPFYTEGGDGTIGLPTNGVSFQSGQSTSVQLGPASVVGATGNLNYYGYWAGGGNATLTFYYNTGPGSLTAGSGAAGQVEITYVTSTSAVIFDTVLEDPWSGYNLANGFWTAPIAGWYQVTATVWTATPSNAGVLLDVAIAGGTPDQCHYLPTSIGGAVTAEALVYLGAGESTYVLAGLEYAGSSFSTSLTAGEQSTIEICWLSP